MANLIHKFSTKNGNIGPIPIITSVDFPKDLDGLKTSPLFKDESTIVTVVRKSYVIEAQRKLRADPETFRSEDGKLQGFVFGNKYETVKVTELSLADFPDEAVRATLEAKITHLRWVD